MAKHLLKHAEEWGDVVEDLPLTRVVGGFEGGNGQAYWIDRTA